MRHGKGVSGITKVRTEPDLRPAESLEFRDVVPGVQKALLWGDDAKGAYGALTKFQAGHKNPLHSHASDIKIVVLKGAYIYTGPDGKTTRLGAGSYGVIPAGHPHVSEGDSGVETLFVEIGGGKFSLDLVPE